MDDKPLPVDLLVNVSDAKREIQGLAVLVGARGSEDPAPICEASLGFRLPVAHLGTDGARVSCQKVFPIFSVRCGTDVLAGREGIKNEQTLIWRVVRHYGVNILGIDSGYEMLHRRVDVSLVIPRGTGRGGRGGDHRQRCEHRATQVHLTVSLPMASYGSDARSGQSTRSRKSIGNEWRRIRNYPHGREKRGSWMWTARRRPTRITPRGSAGCGSGSGRPR